MQKILLLAGMTPDHRIFDRLLPLLPTAQVIDWIRPIANDSIVSYAARLSHLIRFEEPIVVCGVSFGGIIARELAWHLKATKCVLISSVRTPRELPPWFRIGRMAAPQLSVTILHVIGRLATCWPRSLRTVATWRLRKLAGDSGQWHRWATAAVMNWRPSEHAGRVPSLHIHGDRDATFPLRYTSADMVIRGGGHVLPLTHSREIATHLRQIAG